MKSLDSAYNQLNRLRERRIENYIEFNPEIENLNQFNEKDKVVCKMFFTTEVQKEYNFFIGFLSGMLSRYSKETRNNISKYLHKDFFSEEELNSKTMQSIIHVQKKLYVDGESLSQDEYKEQFSKLRERFDEGFKKSIEYIEKHEMYNHLFGSQLKE